MSAFPTQPIPEPKPFGAARDTVDSLIEQNRAKTPVAAVDARSKPRLSIKELNQLDTDELHDTFLNSGPLDDRHPVQKVLDIIDLPRNTNANILFGKPTASGIAGSIGESAAVGAGLGALASSWTGPGALAGAGIGAAVGGGIAAASHAAAGIGRLFTSDDTKDAISQDKELATGNQPRISMSDALHHLGVENRVASAILGFAGDVAFDPTTYLGPGAFKSVGGAVLRGGFGKAVKVAAKEAAEKGVQGVADDALREVITHAGVAGATDHKVIRKGIEDFIGKYGTVAKTAQNAAEHPAINAYDNLLQKWGRGTGGGFKIGEGGSEVAHIPFTDVTLQVPAFTTTGQKTVRQFQRLRDSAIATDILSASPDIAAVKADLDGMRNSMSAYHAGQASTLTGQPNLFGPTAAQAAADIEQRMDRIAQTVQAGAPGAIPGLNTHGVLAMGEMAKEAEAIRDLSRAQKEIELAKGNPDGLAEAYGNMVNAALKYQGMIGGTLNEHLDSGTLGAIETVKQALGTSDDIIGATVLGKTAAAFERMLGQNNGVTRAAQYLDRQGRTTFGLRGGKYPQDIADVHYRLTADAKRAEVDTADALRKNIASIMEKHGVDAAHVDAVHELATIYGYKAAADRLGLPLKQTLSLARVQNGKLVASEYVKQQNALMKMLRNNGVGPAFHADLKQVAKDAADTLGTFGDQEQARYLLQRMIPGYIPNVNTLEAAQGLRVKRGGGLAFDADATAAGHLPAEQFQRGRTTQLYQFQDPATGEWKEFIGFDRDTLDLSEEALAKLKRDNPTDYQRVMDTRSTIEQYDKLAANGVAPAPKMASIQDINDMHAKGRLGPLSLDPGIDLFDRGLPTIMGRRSAMHERSMARADLADIINKVGLPIKSDEFISMAGRLGNGIHTLPNKEQAAITTVKGRFGGDVPMLVTRGRRYRPLDTKMAGYADNPIISSLYDGAKDLAIPEELADKIEDVARVFKDESLNGVLSAVDKFMGGFKSQLLFRPSWLVFDVIGNIANAASGGIDLNAMVKRLPEAIAAKLADHNVSKVAGLAIDTPTGRLTGQDALDYFRKGGAFDRNIPHEIAMQTSLHGLSALPSQFKRSGVLHDLKTDFQFAANQFSQSLGSKPAGAAAGGLKVGWDRVNRFALGPWVKTNAFVNDVMRGAALLALHDSGQDAAAASRELRRILFDYHDLTHFERRYMKNVFPFYSWMRSNLPYQVNQLFQRPAFIAAFPKVQNALEEAIDGDQRVPMNMRPRWMRGSLMTQIGQDPDSRIGLALDNAAPQGDVLHAIAGIVGWDGAKEMMHYFGGSVNPVIQTPLAIGAGRDYFSGRSIGGEPGEGDMTASEYLTNQIGPVGLARGVIKAAEQGPAQAAGKFLVGGRIQSFDEGRLTSTRARDFRDMAEQARRAVTMAERNGDKAGSLRARARLLRVYEAAMKAGVGQEANVPKWAKDALSEQTSVH